jgi:hypothetical protein
MKIRRKNGSEPFDIAGPKWKSAEASTSADFSGVNYK